MSARAAFDAATLTDVAAPGDGRTPVAVSRCAPAYGRCALALDYCVDSSETALFSILSLIRLCRFHFRPSGIVDLTSALAPETLRRSCEGISGVRFGIGHPKGVDR